MRTKGVERANTKAREIIEKARQEFGYTFEQISELCEVSIGSVQRWYSTGRAQANKIITLEKKLENVRLDPEQIAKALIEIYKFRGKRYCITYNQLRKMSGRDRLSPSIISEIQEEVDSRDFILIEDVIDGKTLFAFLNRKWCFKDALIMTDENLTSFYTQKFDTETENNEEV
jgi:hypothetical protein